MSEGRGRPDFFDFYRGVIEGRRRSDFFLDCVLHFLSYSQPGPSVKGFCLN